MQLLKINVVIHVIVCYNKSRLEKAEMRGCGGMADASDSKSDVGDYVRVQVPPSALNFNERMPKT